MPLPPCENFAILLERFVDGECAADESLRVREHLSACSPCRLGLRSISDLSRRIAQCPAPPVPSDLEDRIRRALRSAQPAKTVRSWIPAGAAAVLLAAVIVLLQPSPARAGIPAFVTAGVAVHEAFLSGAARVEPNASPDALRAYFLRVLKAEVVAPGIEDWTCIGGSPCSIEENQAPWILYRRGGTPISLILVEDGPAVLPETSRRIRSGRGYHCFQVGGNSVVVCRTGAGAHLWIARLPEEELVACALETREGRDAFSGEKVPIRDVVCRACCARAEARAKGIEGVTEARVNLASMEILVTGNKRLDLARIIRELREAGIDVPGK